MDRKRWTNSWPPRSPDLSPLDFFIWGHVKTIVRHVKTVVRHVKTIVRHVKTIVYSTKHRSLDDLRTTITNVIQRIIKNQLQNVFVQFQHRMSVCMHNDGAHVQN